MQPALFISDLHLDGSRPDITAQFLEFLQGEARHAQALYILGDLFETWIGDDDPDPGKRRIVQGLRSLTDDGVPCHVMHGNRDFLLGKRFFAETGTQPIADSTVVNLYGRRVLLLHGDTLCIDDPAYQRLRRIVHNPVVQLLARSLSLQQRQRLARKLRAGSKAHIDANAKTRPYIMDVNAQEVVRILREQGVDCMIHGHTHRPAIHEIALPDGSKGTRIVLGDWYEQGSVLRWDRNGYELAGLRRAA